MSVKQAISEGIRRYLTSRSPVNYSDLEQFILEEIQKATAQDRHFLAWVAERLVYVHGENPNVDFVHKLRDLAGIKNVG